MNMYTNEWVSKRRGDNISNVKQYRDETVSISTVDVSQPAIYTTTTILQCRHIHIYVVNK